MSYPQASDPAERVGAFSIEERSVPDWSAADEWFAEFISELEQSPKRRRRLWRERVEVPAKETLARAFEEKTEQLRRYLAQEAVAV